MYTLEVYKTDKRFKSGKRFVIKMDYAIKTLKTMQKMAEEAFPANSGYTYSIHETYLEKTNLISGEKYLERYDTPHYCSPSSETYWSA